MKRVLILQNVIYHYRKPFYNKMAESFDVTVLHSGKPSVLPEDKYKEIVAPVKRFSKIYIQKGVRKEVKSEKYDVIITMMDIQWINNVFASFYYPKSSKFTWWGIIASKNSFANRLRGLFLRKKPTIFYTESGLKTMNELGFKSNNYTFCNNTFHIENRIPCHKEENKDAFIFVGSMDPRKRLDVMINAFANAIPYLPSSIKLKLIGNGVDFEKAKNLIEKLKIKDRIQLLGRINETEILQEHYKSALASISFGQAGLGVLQSLGYGVPFITSKNAISGGEICNINHESNGYLIEDNQASLEQIMIKLGNDVQLSKLLGKNAFDHYTSKCTIEHMANKFKEVILA